MTLEVDDQECLGCGACESACPVGAISQSTGFPVAYEVDPLLCNDCSRCLAVCPRRRTGGRSLVGGLPRTGLPPVVQAVRGLGVLGGPGALRGLRLDALAGAGWRMGLQLVPNDR
jgi:NAD-dependent dihydropyrimidine dehydrogenase PreA subunit